MTAMAGERALALPPCNAHPPCLQRSVTAGARFASRFMRVRCCGLFSCLNLRRGPDTFITRSSERKEMVGPGGGLDLRRPCPVCDVSLSRIRCHFQAWPQGQVARPGERAGAGRVWTGHMWIDSETDAPCRWCS